MDVSCDKCEAKFKIPDEKVPKDQAFSLTCPKCKNKITIEPKAAAKPAPPHEEKGGDAYDAADKPFDFLEEGTETALVCENEPDLRAKIREGLEGLGYQTREPKTPIEALKQMRFHTFDVIVLDELFGTTDPEENNVLRFLERMPMEERRNIYLALITERFRSSDHMAAFNKSVNIVINRSNINDIGPILKRGVAENVVFYRVYKESMIKTGRA
jgi:predicted Zn finger-like uncharacterized protein